MRHQFYSRQRYNLFSEIYLNEIHLLFQISSRLPFDGFLVKGAAPYIPRKLMGLHCETK